MSLALLALALAGQTVAGLPPARTRGAGARVPFLEYEAEALETNGTRIAPTRRLGMLAAEASARSGVRLDRSGAYVALRLERAADAITVRYAVPDTGDGQGADWTLGLYADGVRIGSLRTTSRYGWLYGAYPFTNRPADGRPRRMFDHARLAFGRRLPRGTRLELRVGPGDTAPWYAIDLIDLERLPPPRRAPAGALDVVTFGADPSGVRPSIDAFRRAIAAAQRVRRPVWVPPGHYRVEGHLSVDRVTIAGAGAWRSVLFGDGVGLYGRPAADGGSRRVTLRDFAVIGEVADRQDSLPLAGVGGAISGARIDRLWLQHLKVGLWLDGPMTGVRVRRTRIFDVTADGLNLHRGVVDARIEDLFVRGTGDDGLAAWSQDRSNRRLRFRRNTVVAPALANGIAIYGGTDIAVARNIVADTLTEGGGLHAGNRFGAVPLAGRIRFDGNVAVRSGSWDPNWRFGVGAFWLYALDHPIAATVTLDGGALIDSSEAAVSTIGRAVTDLSLRNVRIDGTGGHLAALRSPGAIALDRMTTSGIGTDGILVCAEDVRLTGGDAGRHRPVAGPCGNVAPAIP